MIRIMAHPAAAIANEFLKRALAEGVSLTNMHLQKLVYIAHGWNLAVNNEPLVDEQFRAWDFGPVLHSLYHSLRRYGAGRVERMIRRGDDTPYDIRDDGEAILASLEPPEVDVIDQVWDEFKGFKAFQLSALTHKVNSPWEKAYNTLGQNAPIANNSIQDYFAVLADAP